MSKLSYPARCGAARRGKLACPILVEGDRGRLQSCHRKFDELPQNRSFVAAASPKNSARFFLLITWEGAATRAASNPLALPAHAPAHQRTPRQSGRAFVREKQLGCGIPEVFKKRENHSGCLIRIGGR